jgi:hypothetical protein
LLKEIKALLKQAVPVPSNYNGLGTQIQLFAAAANIFFGTDSVCTTNLWQLLLLVSWKRKSFRDQIALNKFFAAKFLFAIDRRVQRWLRSCKQAYHSHAEVNNRVLQFYDTIDEVLNVTFQMILPPTFKISKEPFHWWRSKRRSKEMRR